MYKKTKKNIKNRFKLKKLSKKNLLGGQTLNLFEYYQKYCYKQDKFLVYMCKYRKGTASFCGGLSDRIRGIVGLFILSLISQRQFKIIMNNGDNLINYLIPNKIDWFSKDIKSKDVWWIDNRHSILDILGCTDKSIKAYFDSQPKYFLVITNYLDDFPFLNSKCISQRSGNLNLDNINVLKVSFDILFKLDSKFKKKIDTLKRKIGFNLHNIISCHIRINHHNAKNYKNNFELIVNRINYHYKYILGKPTNKPYLLLLFSDSKKFIEYCNINLKIPFIPTNHLGHIDVDSQNTFLGTLLDFFLIRDSNYIIKSAGGFADLAHKLSDNSKILSLI